MKRVFVIHRWEGSPNDDWRPWLKRELEKLDIVVYVPAMPNTDKPKMSEWVRHLSHTVKVPDKHCYFVGHSLGCITILRYLETLQEKQKVGGAVLVAGFSDNLGFKELDSFFQKPVDWDKIKSHCSKFIAIHSDNDPWVDVKHGNIFKEKLNAELIIRENMGHFSGDEGVTELPVVLESVLKLAE